MDTNILLKNCSNIQDFINLLEYDVKSKGEKIDKMIQDSHQ